MTDEVGATHGEIPGRKRPGCAEFVRTFVNRATLSYFAGLLNLLPITTVVALG